MKKNVPPKLRRFPTVKQRRMDELLDKNADGTITPQQKKRLCALVAEAENLAIYNGKLLARFARSQGIPPGAPPDAVPVTVWVAPQRAG
jgi:hypothetical protein